MEEVRQTALDLQMEIGQALERLGYRELLREKAALDTQTADPALWQDADKARSTLKRQADLERRVDPWRALQISVDDLAELTQLDDDSLSDDLFAQIAEAREHFEKLKQDLKFNGPYDDHDAIISIYAGAGGTDAQDWTQMLLRMYVRWAEKSGYQVHTADESPGEEAGLKSVTIELSGDFAYGKLKGEHGVHRLVRLSPFNADNLRQTSFARVDVLPKIDQPEDLEIGDKDLRIDVYRSGGHGGQSVNTTDSAVRVTHLPSSITVAIQNERSQLQNRETALTILRSRLAQLQMEQHRTKLADLKGPTQSAEWGNQIRSYVLHPYKQVKDLRTHYETSDADGVLAGNLDPLITAYLETTPR